MSPGDAPGGAPRAVIRRGARFDGVIVLHGPARIDGRVRGQVLSPDRVWIGPEGCVEASVDAAEVVVAGEVRGDVRGRQRVELQSTARVQGAVISPRVALAEGSRLEGQCLTGEAARRASSP